MSPDNTHSSNPDAQEEVLLRHGALEIARDRFVRAVARLARAGGPQAAALRTTLAQEAFVMRALHALSVGYGWSEAIHRVATPQVLEAARVLGHVGTDLATGCPVLTATGMRALQRWRDFVAPVAALPGYAPMWRYVHSLDG